MLTVTGLPPPTPCKRGSGQPPPQTSPESAPMIWARLPHLIRVALFCGGLTAQQPRHMHPGLAVLPGCAQAWPGLSTGSSACSLFLLTSAVLAQGEERPGGGGVAQGLGIRVCAFAGAYWPLATAHSDPLWARTCFDCVNGAPG